MASLLNCMALVPIPDLPEAGGVIRLLPIPTPFGVAVTPDGAPRHHLRATLEGLPDPGTLGPYTRYVAWAYTVSLDSVVRLGEVRNGDTDLGEFRRAQFRVLITAEPAVEGADRSGRLVLRGTSPAARLLVHRDLLEPSAPGALRDFPERTAPPMAADHGMLHGSGGAWPMPPMTMPMAPMPGMDGLVPSVAPFRAGAGVDPATIPAARPRELARLGDGDTLDLTAGLVRRSVAGGTVVMYGFNGQYPGPLIEVTEGATILVRFHNAIDQPSSVHWHGVRLDNRFDGAVGVTQDPVAPGETFQYRVRFPDAGLYWYHPHVREDIQQDLGLYGNMLVRSREPGYFLPAHREEIVMLDDLLLDERGLAPHGAEAPTHALMGRHGNVPLVNGEPRYERRVRRGEVVRYFLTNVANARVFNLSFGAGARVKVVGGDIGKFEREEWATNVVIAPAERYIVEVEYAEPGTALLTTRVHALDHMSGSFWPAVDTLGAVTVAAAPADARRDASFGALRDHRDVAAELAPFRAAFARPVDRTLVLTLRTRGLPAPVANMLQGINAAVDWNDGMPMMNWVTTGREVTWVLRDRDTGRENMDIDWRFRLGEVIKLRIVNDASASHAMQHPIHIHGQRFLVLSRDGVPTTNLGWKDTVLIPAGETVDLLVEMSNPGRWMLHCHVAEHLGVGMMGVFTVEPHGAPPREDANSSLP